MTVQVHDGEGGIGVKEPALESEAFEGFVRIYVDPRIADETLEALRSSSSRESLGFLLGRSWELRNMAARLTRSARVI